MKARALKGKAVVSMADGVQIGRVEEVLFDTAALKVAALVLTTTGGRSILPFAAVRSLGADAVTVESATATQPAAAQADAGNLLRALGDLTGLKVVNGEGAYLGDVRDVTIDQASGTLTELEAHSGGMLGVGGTGVTVLGHPGHWTGPGHGRHARALGRGAQHSLGQPASSQTMRAARAGGRPPLRQTAELDRPGGTTRPSRSQRPSPI
jgi:sporulation protein YlmC with PRC-barrel domain